MGNILKIRLNKETQIVSSSLYQYDYGQKVRIFGLDLPAHYEVHFSNHEHGNATTVLASSNEFDIPDMYLQSGRDIYIWIYLHTGADDGETEYQITVPVLKRAKPTDEPPTEEEEGIITQTIAALNNAVTEARAISADVTEKDEHVNQLYTDTNNAKIDTYHYKEEAEAAAELLKNPSTSTTTLSPGQEAIASYSNGTFSFGIPTGLQGPQGPKGDVGPIGPQGEVGPQGPQGERGLQGERGETGLTGATGERGPKGDKGDTGERGEKGDAFTYDDFTPEQLASLVGPQGPVGPKGDTGATGSQGAKGDKAPLAHKVQKAIPAKHPI